MWKYIPGVANQLESEKKKRKISNEEKLQKSKKRRKFRKDQFIWPRCEHEDDSETVRKMFCTNVRKPLSC